VRITCANIFFPSASRFSSCYQSERGKSSGCSCSLCLNQCFLSVFTCVAALYILFLPYVSVHVHIVRARSVSLPAGAGDMELQQPSYGIRRLLPPPTGVHRTTPADWLRKSNLLVTLSPVQILPSLWDTESGFSSHCAGQTPGTSSCYAPGQDFQLWKQILLTSLDLVSRAQ